MKRDKKTKKIIMIFFLIVDIVIFALLFSNWNDTKNFMKNAIKTEATITKIDEKHHGGDTDYLVYVSYYVDGKSYNEELNSYSSSMREGNKVTIYYNPNNPSEIRSNDNSFDEIILLLYGYLFILIPLIFFVINFIKKRKEKRIIAYGCLIYANIDHVFKNRSIKVMGVRPFVIKASTVGPDGLTYEFTSSNIYYDIRDLIRSNNIGKIKVYVNPSNYKEYVMDIESLSEFTSQ